MEFMKKAIATTLVLAILASVATAKEVEVSLDKNLRGQEEVDPRAFFVGSVARSYNNDLPYSCKTIDFTDYINDSAKTIKSVTDEVFWDYKNGFVKLDTPTSQGVTGLLGKAGKIKLSDTIIETKNEHCTIFVIALDGKPINESEKILIQSGQEDRLYGYRERYMTDNSGNRTNRKEITELGQYPYNVVNTQAIVTLKNIEKPEKIFVLDENGYARTEWKRWATDQKGQTLVLLPQDSMYTILLRGDAAKSVSISKAANTEYVDGVDYIWWEAEDDNYIVEIDNFNREAHRPLEDFPETAHLLSGGDWLTNSGEWKDEDTKNPPTVKYKLNIKEGSSFNLYVRKFWFHGWFRYKFDDQPWVVVNDNYALLDETFLKTFWSANWMQIGGVDLTEGEHILTVEQVLKPGGDKGTGMDCFLLTRTPFTPRGLLRPGEKSGKADVGMWAFEPNTEQFTDENLIDLRYLNEGEAGQDGRLTQKDGKFYLGSGEEVRLWGVNVSTSDLKKFDKNSLDYFARLLAKYGVNYVRLHGIPWDANFVMEDATLDNTQYFVSALKKNGIYTKISAYFVLWNNLDQNKQFMHVGEVGPDGYIGFLPHNKEGFGYIIWNEDLQNAYYQALAKLLTSPNKYGTPLVEDPAVAVIEVQNEDSFLFYTFENWRMPDADRAQFGMLFGKWLVKKYGSLKAITAAWGDNEPTDTPPDFADDYTRLLFEITHANNAAFNPVDNWLENRRRDVYEFFVDTQKKFYEKSIAFLRNDLGYEGLTVASNWTTINNRFFDAAERYTYLPADINDKHGYAGNVEHNTDRAYQVSKGDKMIETPVVLNPNNMPMQAVNTVGQGTSISEINWPNPSSYASDEPFFQAVYGALQGINMFNTFASSTLNWETAYGKWTQSVPSRMGQWAGLALAYRRGDITQAPIVALENIPYDALMNMPVTGNKIFNGANIDDVRK